MGNKIVWRKIINDQQILKFPRDLLFAWNFPKAIVIEWEHGTDVAHIKPDNSGESVNENEEPGQ